MCSSAYKGKCACADKICFHLMLHKSWKSSTSVRDCAVDVTQEENGCSRERSPLCTCVNLSRKTAGKKSWPRGGSVIFWDSATVEVTRKDAAQQQCLSGVSSPVELVKRLKSNACPDHPPTSNKVGL